MHHANLLLIATAAIGLLAAASAVAIEPVEGILRQGEATFLSGGVSESGREQIQAVADRYDFDVKLIFAAADGAYLAEVPVRITDDAGNAVVSAVSEGPWFYADLRPGRYTAVAERDGIRRESAFTVRDGGGLQELTFTFPVARDEVSRSATP